MADTLKITSPIGIKDMPPREYHTHPAISSTMLEVFRDSRRTYYGLKVAGDMRTEPPTKSMDFGIIIHLMILEPERVSEAIADPFPEVAPDGKKWLRRKGSDHEKWWAEEEEKRKGKLALSADDWERAQAVVESVKSNKQAMSFLEREGTAEYSIFWKDKDTGLDFKCRVDWMSSVALDLKTTADPTPRGYANQLASLGYHRKKAHYEAGLLALYGKNAPRFAHIAIETSSPFRVACYELDDRDGKTGESLGRNQRRATIWELAKCYETGDWREPWEKRPKVLSLPGWAFREAEYTYLENPQ